MFRRSVGLAFHIDTNRINSRQKLPYMNLLEKWGDNGIIRLEKSEVTFNEAFYGENKKRKNKTMKGFYSRTYSDTPEEMEIIKNIEKILFPNGAKNTNEKNDIEIVFNAKKYFCILITNDGDSKSQPKGILGNADILKEKIGVEVMTDKEAVELVIKKIKNRNITFEKISKRNGEPLPKWAKDDLENLTISST